MSIKQQYFCRHTRYTLRQYYILNSYEYACVALHCSPRRTIYRYFFCNSQRSVQRLQTDLRYTPSSRQAFVLLLQDVRSRMVMEPTL